ncbi:ABC transporter permease [Marinihelvus fidelis]|uniref:ABC transporter permease n=1 Tax=Marinihelvus fidelis TaxID=2613842 RepID=A0A5N0T943_9GAMM|nr:ABC transporter permease [Marinihelvus fidelis]KAA9129819.1 ABC transporter permease [Marinihelvus fidelis]
MNKTVTLHQSTGLAALPAPVRRLLGIGVKNVVVPLLGIVLFLGAWSMAARNIDTSLGQFPGPATVAQQFGSLVSEHRAEREKAEAFYQRQEERNAERLALDPTYEAKIRPYTGKETFFDQIRTSLVTVMCGFALAAVIAIPFGIAIGLSETLYTAVNPVIQVLKPISPLAWLPMVTMVVSALYVSADPVVPKSFLNSMITVTLCCLWPMLINTAVGVASISQDLVNVSRVLSLPPLTHVRRIVLPAAVPAIFTGMRLSIGIAWMVLIAAEMLAQNPGLGKFVWDEFQNGSSDSLGRILTAAIVIGFIGFLLDRGMLTIQRFVSWDRNSAAR